MTLDQSIAALMAAIVSALAFDAILCALLRRNSRRHPKHSLRDRADDQALVTEVLELFHKQKTASERQNDHA